MPMRLSGLMSGMDTESIVSQLVEARKTKVTKAVKAQKSLKYKQDAWKDLNKKILNLYNKSLSNMRFESSFVKKTTKVSNSNVVSVITGENAMNSVQSLKVTHLAKTGYLTGGELPSTVKGTDKDGNEIDVAVTGSTTLAELGMTAEGSSSIKVQVGTESKNISVSGGMTINSFIKSLRDAGLTANFDEANHRIYVAAKTSGEENDFTISAWNSVGLDALQALKLSYDITDKDGKSTGVYTTIAQQNETKYNNLVADRENAIETRTNSRIQSLIDQRANLKTTESDLNDRKTKLEDEREEIAKKVAGLLESDDADYDNWDADKKAEFYATLDEKLAEAISNAEAGGNEELVANLADLKKDWADTASELEKVREQLTTVDKELEEVEGKLDISVDDDGNEVVAVKAEVKQQIADEVEAEVDAEIAQAKKEMEDFQKVLDNGYTATKQAGADAEIYLNGVQYTSSRNTFDINGLTMTVSSLTSGDEEVTITTEDDVSGVYDMIKNFIKEYSTLINEMDKLYNADSAKEYEPLTDEEKEAMSDSAIEEWENKIKDSILRRDSTLGTFADELKKIMMEGVEVNGKKMYLSNFGINTLSYFTAAANEKNAYHIDGDPDDENTSGNADVLKSMIANDPDTVVSFFTQLSKNLYNKMFDLMKSKEGYSSAMTAYDDKKMQSDYDDYTSKIKDLEKKLADYEDKWYAKFAAMETALAKMQNNASAVTSLLGG